MPILAARVPVFFFLVEFEPQILICEMPNPILSNTVNRSSHVFVMKFGSLRCLPIGEYNADFLLNLDLFDFLHTIPLRILVLRSIWYNVS